jgi:hypothetical protein
VFEVIDSFSDVLVSAMIFSNIARTELLPALALIGVNSPGSGVC